MGLIFIETKSPETILYYSLGRLVKLKGSNSWRFSVLSAVTGVGVFYLRQHLSAMLVGRGDNRILRERVFVHN